MTPDGLDIEATFAAYRASCERAGERAWPLAEHLWARLDPQRWALEWHLPVWLGRAFGLDRAVSRRLGVSNVLGLAAVKLADDLRDGDVADDDFALAEALRVALYDDALAPYRELFPRESPLWARLDGWMRESAAAGQLPGDLVRRGAPLKIPAFAICRLTGRTGTFGRLEACLDHALTAMVLYDHAHDWREDLAAGRWNAFAGDERDPRRVEARLLSGAAIGPYFARIDRELERAAAVAVELGIDGLAAHLSNLRASVGSEARTLETRYDALGNAAMQLLFGQYAT